jgi:cytochrome oxidase Cu insertion factor (SCO1/SenC/PrrC family)
LSKDKDVTLTLFRLTTIFLAFALITSACAPVQADVTNTPELQTTIIPISTVLKPDWFDMELMDAQTGETFTVNDHAGKVILLETMAIWCPNCAVQGHEVRKLHESLGHPEDLISISLDVDINEDRGSLKEYAHGYGFDWHFAIAPLEVARALDNLYTAQYLNPPLSPMLVIDRDGNVHHLEYGLKEAETLQKIVEPYLAK